MDYNSKGCHVNIFSDLGLLEDLFNFGDGLCCALRDLLLHKLQMAGALCSFEEPLRYGYFWNQGVKLHHIGWCHFVRKKEKRVSFLLLSLQLSF